LRARERASYLTYTCLRKRGSYLPKLRCVDDLVLVQRLGDIIGRVELGSADSGGRSSCGLLVRGEGASILGLDGPQSPLVVGLGPAVTAHAPDEILVPACSRWLRHRCCLSPVPVCAALGQQTTAATTATKRTSPRASPGLSCAPNPKASQWMDDFYVIHPP
jgi:hypothetical protein